MYKRFITHHFKHCYFADAAPDVSTGGGNGGSAPEEGANTEEPSEEQPSVEELMAQLAKERAANERNKFALDKALKDNGNLKKQVRERMSADEQAALSREEQEAENKALKAQLRTMEYSKNYMSLGMESDAAETLAGVTGELTDAEAFFDALGKYIANVKKHASEDAVQTYLKENPVTNAGSGRSSTNTIANELAKKAAANRGKADENILKYYIGG